MKRGASRGGELLVRVAWWAAAGGARAQRSAGEAGFLKGLWQLVFPTSCHPARARWRSSRGSAGRARLHSAAGPPFPIKGASPAGSGWVGVVQRALE